VQHLIFDKGKFTHLNSPYMARKGNTLKKNTENEEKENSKPREKKIKSNIVGKLLSIARDERLEKVTGLALLLASVFMLIAFTSFLFTWKADQDKVAGPWITLLTHADITVDNWLGKTGAIVSFLFINNWFGISSFAFVLLSFLGGFKILFEIQLLPIRKTLIHSLFSLLFFSTTLGYLFSAHSNFLFLGGAFGFEVNKWLTGTFGSIGTALLLVFTAVAFVAITFKISFKIPAKLTEAPAAMESSKTLEAEIEIPSGNKFIIPDAVDEKKEDDYSIELDIKKETREESRPKVELTLETPPLPDSPVSQEQKVELAIENPEAENAVMDEVENILGDTLGDYDPTLDLSSYRFPEGDLLENYDSKRNLSSEELRAELESNKDRIVQTLGHYNIGIDKIKATVGPTVTLFEIVPVAGVKISKIKNLEDDIALSLAALGIRIIAPMPGKGTIGIEVPNQKPEVVSMKSVLVSDKFIGSDYDLPIGLGKTISNEVFVADLAKMPHLLMAGATGQGKSVGLNAVLVSLLYKKHPSQVKFVLVDPKKVELTLFKKIERHFLAKLPGEEDAIITDTKKVVNTLNSLCIEMDQRYDLLKEAQVRNIREYNAKFVSRRLNPNNGHRFLPFIVLVVDEFADLIMTAGKEIETPIARLAQLARAIGIHLIIATQRPSVNIITGTIKANFPARLAFRVSSKIDSRTILDTGGADQLIGRGDMLLSTGADLIRLQCAFVDTPEVEKITDFIGSQRGYPDAFLLPEYVGEADKAMDIDAGDRDPLFEDAARIIVMHQQGSASLLQRKLKLGYNRAGRLVDQLEAAGIIGPFEGSKAREVRVKDEMSLEQYLNVAR
jgi:S-DNA-T family DNA segregation ATPase FtsK/SpoIIIE